MQYLIIPDEQLCDGWIHHRHDGKIEFRYHDHHGVRQDEGCQDMKHARYRMFRWRLVRSLFTAEIYGGSTHEVAEAYGVPILYTEDANQ